MMDFLELLKDSAWVTAIGVILTSVISSVATYLVTKNNNKTEETELAVNDRMQLSKDQYQLIAELRDMVQEQRNEIDEFREEIKQLQAVNINLTIENRQLQYEIKELSAELRDLKNNGGYKNGSNSS